MARAPRIEEERPPHDALEGVSLPRETSILVGHEVAERTLLDAYRSARMHHGWILAGERGIGKATLAYRLARFIFANPDPASRAVADAPDLSVSADHPAARRVAAGTHPNLLRMQREWDERNKRYRSALSVDAIRRIIPFLGTTAGEEGWRVVIVDPADDMTPSAANAVLKNLEEPPRPHALPDDGAATRRAAADDPFARRTLDLAPLSAEQTEAVVDARSRRTCRAARRRRRGGARRRQPAAADRAQAQRRRRALPAAPRGDRTGRPSGAAQAVGGDGAIVQTTEQFLELFEGYLSRRVHGAPEPAAEAKPPAAAACHLGGAMGEGRAILAGGRRVQSRPPAVRAGSSRGLGGCDRPVGKPVT